jgi:molecular chaperone DnaK
MEKVLRDNADKVDDAEKATVEAPLAELKTALAGNDMEAIRSAHDKLMAASQAFSQKLYENAARDENAAGTSASGQAGESTSSDDDIVDAEIVEEDTAQ